MTPDTTALRERLRDAADRFLKWAYKEPYAGPPVISIPRHRDNIDALLLEAEAALLSSAEEAEANADRAFKNAAITMEELEAAEAALQAAEARAQEAERERDTAREASLILNGDQAAVAVYSILRAKRDAAEVALQAAETRAQQAEARVERAIQAADAILARVTMVAGRYLYDAPSADLVPVLAEEKVELTAQMFRDLYNATSRDGSEIR